MKWQRLHRLYHATSQRIHRHRRRMQDLRRSFKWESAPLGTTTTRLWPPASLGSLLELAHWAQTASGPELGFSYTNTRSLELWAQEVKLPPSACPGFNYASIHAAAQRGIQ